MSAFCSDLSTTVHTVKTQLDILLERLLQRAGSLYSLPAVAIKVLELADDPQLDTPRLKAYIENDPALTSRILRVVNSSLFGLSSPVGDLGQALTLLGVKPLKLLVLGFSLPEGLYAGVEAKLLQWYWRHTLTKAVSARQLSQTLWHQAGDDAFLVGLLQDLGMLLLIQSLGSPYQEFVHRVRSMGKDLLVLERQVIGFDHTELTVRLLRHWRLPEGIVQWVSWQDIYQRLEQPSSPPAVVAQVIHLAEGLARVLVDGQPGYLHEVLSAGQKYRALSQTQLEELVADLEAKVAQLAEVLHLDLPPTEDYRTILLEAHRRLSEAAAEALEMFLSRRSTSTPEVPSSLQPHLAHLSEALQRLSGPPVASKQTPPSACPTQTKKQPSVPLPKHSLEENPDNEGAEVVQSPALGNHKPRDPEARLRANAKVLPAKGVAPPPGENQPPPPALVPSDAWTGAEGVGAEKSARWASVAGTIRPSVSDPALLAHLKESVAACRNARTALSLLLAEPLEQNDLMFRYGLEGMERFRSLLEAAAKALLQDSALLFPYSDWGLAMILPDCDRAEAVRLAHQLLHAIRQVNWGGIWNCRGGLALAVGVASVDIPPKNFPAQDLLEAAARCLFASHASGGSVVKSIEIY